MQIDANFIVMLIKPALFSVNLRPKSLLFKNCKDSAFVS